MWFVIHSWFTCDKTLLQAIAHPFFTASKGEKAKLEFVVNHFATTVRYSAVGFVEKNRNDIAQEVYDCYENSRFAFVRALPGATDDKIAKKVGFCG